MSGIAAASVVAGSAAIGGISGYLGKRAGDKSANAAARALKEGIINAEADINKYFGEAEGFLTPYESGGRKAFDLISDIMGLNGPEAQASAYEKFQTDPGYKFQVTQANEALQRSALAKSDIFSGNFAAASGELNTGLADQSFGNYYKRLLGLAEGGRETAGALAKLKSAQGTSLGNIHTGQAGNFADIQLAKGQNEANFYSNMGNTASDIWGAGASYYFNSPKKPKAPVTQATGNYSTGYGNVTGSDWGGET